MIDVLSSLVLAVWVLLGASPQHIQAIFPVSRAIAGAISEDLANPPVLGSHLEDAVAMAEWAFLESGVDENPVPRSWDAKDLVSCGIWQEPCTFVRASSVRAQARYWLRLAHEGSRNCPESPLAPLSGGCNNARTMADHRVARSRHLVTRILSPDLDVTSE